MPESNLFGDPGNWLYITTSLVAFANVIHTIFTNDLLKEHYLKVLYACLLFLLFCCLTVLSNICVLRRKSKSDFKPVLRLRDSDLESEDDENQVIQTSESASPRDIRQEFSTFLRSRRIYKLIAMVGAVFIILAIFLTIASYFYDSSVGKDFYCSAKVFFISGLFLEILVWVASYAPRFEDLTATYKPFEESIRIPMKIFVPKVVRHLAKRGLNITGIVFYQFAAIFALVSVIDMPEGEIQRFKDVSRLKEIHAVMILMTTFANVCGFVLLLGSFWTACDLAREDLFIAFEKNWRQNLVALDFFLQDKNVSTLEQVSRAFLEKSRSGELTPEEREALKYIEKPLWKTKPEFVDKRERVLSTMQSGSSVDLSVDITSPSMDRGPSPPRFSPPLTRSRARRSSISLTSPR